MGFPEDRSRSLKPLSYLNKAAYSLLVFVVALSKGDNWGAAAAAGKRPCLTEGTEEIEKHSLSRLKLFWCCAWLLG